MQTKISIKSLINPFFYRGGAALLSLISQMVLPLLLPLDTVGKIYIIMLVISVPTSLIAVSLGRLTAEKNTSISDGNFFFLSTLALGFQLFLVYLITFIIPSIAPFFPMYAMEIIFCNIVMFIFYTLTHRIFSLNGKFKLSQFFFAQIFLSLFFAILGILTFKTASSWFWGIGLGYTISCALVLLSSPIKQSNFRPEINNNTFKEVLKNFASFLIVGGLLFSCQTIITNSHRIFSWMNLEDLALLHIALGNLTAILLLTDKIHFELYSQPLLRKAKVSETDLYAASKYLLIFGILGLCLGSLLTITFFSIFFNEKIEIWLDFVFYSLILNYAFLMLVLFRQNYYFLRKATAKMYKSNLVLLVMLAISCSIVILFNFSFLGLILLVQIIFIINSLFSNLFEGFRITVIIVNLVPWTLYLSTHRLALF